MIYFKQVIAILSCLFLSLVSNAYAESLDAATIAKYTHSEKRAIVYGGKYIDAGEFEKSNQILSTATQKFPKNDVIMALYGKSLYETGKKDIAEEYFMRALRLDANNILAQQYIEQIRQVRALSVSESTQEWAAMIKDKSGDLIVFVISIWLGTSLNSFWTYFVLKWKWLTAKRKYHAKAYDDVTNILESHVVNMEQDEIYKGLNFMVNHSGFEEVRKILELNVIRQDNLIILLRSLELLEKKKWD